MEGRKVHLHFHTFSRVCLSLAFNHARHKNIVKVVKLQEKMSEEIFNK